ncbi:MAG: S8 family peptidase, partial [Armatimonadetes bacterium]|nr:S8 family peptidase [Armatimonadota bacterium]
GTTIQLYAVKALSRTGSGWLSDIIEGIQWCIDNNMKVINMSFGSASGNVSFHDAIIKAYQAGIVMVAAAGNESTSVSYPAKYPETIAVTATDSNNSLAYFSNYGPETDLAAPGVGVSSTYLGGGYRTLSGTSMAAPHVTGAAALKLALNGALSPDQVRAALMATAEPLLNLTADQQGAGLVDAYKLVTTP